MCGEQHRKITLQPPQCAQSPTNAGEPVAMSGRLCRGPEHFGACYNFLSKTAACIQAVPVRAAGGELRKTAAPRHCAHAGASAVDVSCSACEKRSPPSRLGCPRRVARPREMCHQRPRHVPAETLHRQKLVHRRSLISLEHLQLRKESCKVTRGP
jgi:hypothetical protein